MTISTKVEPVHLDRLFYVGFGTLILTTTGKQSASVVIRNLSTWAKSHNFIVVIRRSFELFQFKK